MSDLVRAATSGSDFSNRAASNGPPQGPVDTWDRALETAASKQAATQPLADATKTTAAAATGYRANMYGEIGVGPFTTNIAPEKQFGRFEPDSTLARPKFTGYGIDNFAKRTGPALPQQTMISSQGAWDFAHQHANALGLPSNKIFFESKNPLSTDRTYDLQLEPLDPLLSDSVTEIKAGKSIDSRQFSRDVTAAKNGLAVDYQFARNPITGNHGPDAAVAARLNAATRATNSNFTWGVANVATSGAALNAVETAAKVSHAVRAVGRVVVPIGIAADAYSISSAIAADGGTFGRNATVATAGAAGGWTGAAAGGWGGVELGTLAGGMIGGPIGAAIGAVAGGLIGAIGGGLFGSWGAERAARAATN